MNQPETSTEKEAINRKFDTRNLSIKLILLLIVTALAVYTGQSFEESYKRFIPEANAFRSVFNEKSSGLNALLNITKRVGLTNQIWLYPYRRLHQEKGLLFVIEPLQDWDELDVATILHWVEEGNQLLYLDNFPNHKLLHKLNLRLIEKKGSEKVVRDNPLYIDRQAVEMQYVRNLQLNSKTKLLGGKTLVGSTDGAYITTVDFGEGRIIVGTVPNICANVKLRSPDNYDNFQFLINCLSTADGAILFDEHCHGITKANNFFSYFTDRLPALLCAQLLLILLIAIAASRVRFGQVKTINDVRHISDLAYISGLANIYKRAQANLPALEIIIRAWRIRLCTRLGLSARLNNQEIIQQAKDSTYRTGKGNIAYEKISANWVNSLSQFFVKYEKVTRIGQINRNQLIELVKESDILDREMRRDNK